MGLVVLDANGDQQTMSTTEDAQNDLVGSSCITDPTSGAKQQVGQQHNSDNVTLAGNASLVGGPDLMFNGSGFDRRRNNVDSATALVTLTASGAGTYNSPTQTNFNQRGCQVGINISAISGTSPTVQVTIQGYDVASATWYTLLQSASLTATGFVLLSLYPGLPAAANTVANQVLPRTFRISVVVGGTGVSVTGTVGMSLIG